MYKLMLGLCLSLLVWHPGQARAESDADTRYMKDMGIFLPSFYWITEEKDDHAPRNRNVKDLSGKVLAQVSDNFFKNLTLEGTGKLLDGRLLNFAKRVKLPDGSSEIRYKVCGADAPYGYGYENRALVPFHTIAVDPKIIPLDTKVYIPEAKGAVLPDGSIHDGYFMALDIGSMIQEKRVDVFTAVGDQSEVFGRVGMEHMKPVHVFLVPR